MSLKYNKSVIPQARALRKNMTKQENKMWYDFLNKYKPRFQRQKTIGDYIVDFFCAKAFLALEIDGEQHYKKDGFEYDKIRTAHLNNMGVTVMRVTNREVDNYFDIVCEQIDRVVKSQLSEKPSKEKTGKEIKQRITEKTSVSSPLTR